MAGVLLRFISLILIFSAIGPMAFAQIRLVETGAPNSKYVSLQAPASVPANFTWTLPSGDGSPNQCLATNGSGTLIWYTPAGGGSAYSLNANDGSPVNAVYVEAAGKVGIGTTVPVAQLEVTGDINIATNSLIGGNLYYSSGWKYGTNGYAGGIKLSDSSGGGMSLLVAGNNSSGAGAAASPTQALTILPSGYVGVGTATPNASLDVMATDATTSFITSVSGFKLSNTDTTNDNSISMSFRAFDTSAASVAAGKIGVNVRSHAPGAVSADLVFANRNAGNFAESMRILANGNVGVGLTNPLVNLDVAGGVRAGSSTTVTTCGSGAAAGEGTQRYNYTNHVMEYCNGTAWVPTSALNSSLGACTVSNQGQMAYDASTGQMKICNGGAWMTFGQVAVSYTYLASGQQSSCGISNGGALFCWGDNSIGQLGIGTSSGTQNLVPKQVGTSKSWSAISAGYFYGGYTSACGINSGKMYCWGWNGYQQLGTGNTTNYSNPIQIGSATDWTAVAQGTLHTCRIRGGLMHCWGYNPNGQLGTGNATNYNTPQQVGSSTGWTAVTAAYLYANGGITCGIDSGKLYCWGYNGYGQLGLGNNTSFNTPQQVGALTSWTAVSTDGSSTCGIAAGKLYCWGYNGYGELGLGNSTNFNSPQQVGSATNWTAVNISYGGGGYACGIAAGSLYCWGYNGYGNLGLNNTTNHNTPQQVGSATNWTNINIGPNGYGLGATSCGVAGGVGYCWGANSVGQVGNNTTTDQYVPTAISASN
jgi:alpha-tubulin suppressor-like RCC1 family protein